MRVADAVIIESPFKAQAPPVEAPEPLDDYQEILETDEAAGIVMGTSMHGKQRTSPKNWEAKELTPIMQEIMALQFFNPTITTKEIAQLVNLSPRRVGEIIGCDMYKTKYKIRKAKLEALENSKIVEERKRFRQLRDDMIKAHEDLLNLDPAQYAGKELEVRKIQQKSATDLLRMSTEELRDIDRRLSPRNGNGSHEAMGVEVELDTSDPQKAYMRLVAGFRKGTK